MKTDQGKMITDCIKAADMLIEAGLVTPNTDMTPFFTQTMANVMDRFRSSHPGGRKKKQTLHGDGKTETALAQSKVTETLHIGPQDITIEGSSFVITGVCAQYPRKLLQEKIQTAGGSITRHISRKTRYLVVCDQASRDYLYEEVGTKITDSIKRGTTLVAECDLIKALKEKGLL